jgi:predicted secreted hydrolase
MQKGVSFPRDERAHPVDYEWWYVHGYLENEAGRHFGFMFSFFKFKSEVVKKFFPQFSFYPSGTIYQLQLGVTDITGQRHHFDEMTFIPWLGRTGVSRRRLNIFYGPNKLVKTGPRRYELFMRHHQRQLHLHFYDQKGPVLHGRNGILTFPKLGSTTYYSLPRMTVHGAFERLPSIGTDGGKTDPEFVRGSAWMDHQWGDFVQQQPFLFWNWAGIQLEDGSEIMIYEGFLMDGKSHGVKGTFFGRDGHKKNIEIVWRPARVWQSPKNKTRYPIDFEITIPVLKMHLRLHADMNDQEMNSAFFSYWEGACSVTGKKSGKTITGKAYLELTGYDRLGPAALKKRLVI